jgi:hypothetical protein
MDFWFSDSIFLQGDEITLSGYVGEDEASPESSSGASSWSGETVIAEDSAEKVLYIFCFSATCFARN